MTEKTKKKDPRTPKTLSDPRVQEMRLRDYFAAHALTGFLAANTTAPEGMTFTNVEQVIATAAYTVADAMMEARKQ